MPSGGATGGSGGGRQPPLHTLYGTGRRGFGERTAQLGGSRVSKTFPDSRCNEIIGEWEIQTFPEAGRSRKAKMVAKSK